MSPESADACIVCEPSAMRSRVFGARRPTEEHGAQAATGANFLNCEFRSIRARGSLHAQAKPWIERWLSAAEVGLESFCGHPRHAVGRLDAFSVSGCVERLPPAPPARLASRRGVPCTKT